MGDIRIETLMYNQSGVRKDLAAQNVLFVDIETGYANKLFDFGH